MAIVRNKVNGLLTSVNDQLDSITTIANGILCIPSILKNFLSPGTYRGIFNAIGSVIFSTVQDIIRSTIVSQIDAITNYVNYFINHTFEVIEDGIRAVQDIIAFIKGFRQKIQDSVDFIKNQENCTFAASTMLACVIEQAAQQVRKNIISDIQLNTGKYVDQVANSVSSANGAIDQYIDRNTSFLDKARTQLEFQSLIR